MLEYNYSLLSEERHLGRKEAIGKEGKETIGKEGKKAFGEKGRKEGGPCERNHWEEGKKEESNQR